MDSNYFNKYLKYKTRYLKYKNIQIGNGIGDSEAKSDDSSQIYVEKLNLDEDEDKDKRLHSNNGMNKIYISLKNRIEDYIQILLDNENIKKYIEENIRIFSFDINVLMNILDNKLNNIESIIFLYDDIMDYLLAIKDIIYLNKKVDWFNFEADLDIIKQLYVIREFIVHITIIIEYKINDMLAKDKRTEIVIRDKPIKSLRLLNDGEYFEINISGSKELLSDIDININANGNTTFHITILEKLVDKHEWFDHTLWRVDFFGDTTYVKIYDDMKKEYIYYYIDTRYYDKNTKEQLFMYAIVSMLKHSSEYLKYEDTIKFFIHKLALLIDIDTNIVDDLFEKATIIKSELSTYDTETKDNKYREKLLILDKMINTMYYKIVTSQNKSMFNIILGKVGNYKLPIESLFNKFVLSTAEANIYRDENYILLGTVLHVVSCMQIGNNKCEKYECQDKFITCNPCCTLDNFNLILSAMEQLGYILYKLLYDDEISDNKFYKCTTVANKYFIRFIEALNKYEYNTNNINTVQKSINFKKMIANFIDLDDKTSILKKLKDKRSRDGNPELICEPVLDILCNITVIFRKIIQF
jgi:hypothetical protein